MTNVERHDAAASDDWLERALAADACEHRDRYLADDGFTAKVMAALPSSETLPAWRKPALATIWGVGGIGLALALPGVAIDALSQVAKALAAQPVSLAGIGIGIAALAAASWVGAAVALARD